MAVYSGPREAGGFYTLLDAKAQLRCPDGIGGFGGHGIAPFCIERATSYFHIFDRSTIFGSAESWTGFRRKTYSLSFLSPPLSGFRAASRRISRACVWLSRLSLFAFAASSAARYLATLFA